MKTWIAFWNILKKDVKNYYLKPPNISWGIIFPLSWTLMQFIIATDSPDMRQLLPGLISMSVLFGTTSMLAVTITFERKGKSFDRLLLAPISLNTLVLAKIGGAVAFGIFNAFVPIIIAAFLTDLHGTNWGYTIMAISLIAITSTLLGLLIAISAKEVFEAQTFSNFFRFPMLFLCGLFLPIAKLPALLQPVSYCLPLTYGTDILKGSILNSNFMSTLLAFSALLGFALVLMWWCNRKIRDKWIS